MSQPKQKQMRAKFAQGLVLVHALGAFLALNLWILGRWDGRRPTTSWVQFLFTTFNIPVTPSPISAIFLLLIAAGLLQRKRVALIGVAFSQVIGALMSIKPSIKAVEGFGFLRFWDHSNTIFEAISLPLGVVILVLIIWVAPEFRARVLRGSWWQAAIVFIGGVSSTILLANTIVNDYSTSEQNEIKLTLILLRKALDDTGKRGDLLKDIPGFYIQIISGCLALTIIASILVFARSTRRTLTWTAPSELAVRRLIHDYGHNDSLAYFATRRDKHAAFSADQKAVVTYRVIAGVSLASADPIGDPKSWSAAIGEWLKEARSYGWVPAVISCSEAGARAYAEAGLSVIGLGDEAVLVPERFSLDSTSMARTRQAVNRARRAGITVQIRRQYELSSQDVSMYSYLAYSWLGGKKERGFSMALSRDGDPADFQTLYVTAHDPSGKPVGLLTFVPWGASGVSLSVMRRSPDAPAGVTELMVSELLLRSREAGVRKVSLNFCVFRRTFEDADAVGAPLHTRVGSSLLGFLDRFWQLERLYEANKQYQPTWEPRFFCCDTAIAIPQAGFAAAIAEGHVRWPFTDILPQRGLMEEELQEVIRIANTPSAATLAALPKASRLTAERAMIAQAARDAGSEPWPAATRSPDTDLSHLAEYPWEPGRSVTVAGRIRRIRDFGGVVFIDLTDRGTIIQLLAERERLGVTDLKQLRSQCGRGDVVMITGELGYSSTRTKSILINQWQLQAKCIRPIPFESLTDPETRLRQRSLDLIVHPEQLDVLYSRSLVCRAVRSTLDQAGFLEVETPVLHTVHSGATARPFQTWINAYSTELYLRIAPELFLKRLVIGGMGAVYEMSRNFRNEGADNTHNPEFTSLEAYLPYADYHDMRLLTQDLVRAAAIAIHGRAEIQLSDGSIFDLAQEWPVVKVLDGVSAAVGRPVSIEMDFDELVGICRDHGIPIHDGMGPGALIEELYAELVESSSLKPTFYIDFPVETSPLTRPHRSDPGIAERWDLVVNGMELGTAYTELTDPVDQRARFTDQSLKAAAGDAEAMAVDEEFLAALELGMPPTGGVGIGIDRLAMLLTGQYIRGVLTFPFVKPAAKK